jgi:hypothetical protein
VKARAAAPTLVDVVQISANSSSSVDESRDTTLSSQVDGEISTGTSTPLQGSNVEDSGVSTPPHDSSAGDSGEETDEMSSCHSCEVDTQGREELDLLLRGNFEQNTALLSANNETTALLQQSEENYNALHTKYTNQLEQRQNDRNLVEQAFSSNEAAEDRSEVLEEEVAVLQEQNAALER